MSLSAVEKADVINNIQGEINLADNDTGSIEVQVALLTKRITHLTEHFKTHKNDDHSRYGLKKMVSRRRQLLDYLKKVDAERYRKLIALLGLRR